MNMNTKNLLSLIVAVSFLSCNGQKKSSEVKLTNRVDSVSYGIGLSIGNNLAKDGLENMNLDVMMKAMRTAMDKDSLLMDQQQAGTVIQSYITEARRKKGEEALVKEKA